MTSTHVHAAEVVSRDLALVLKASATRALMRPCFCPECRKHFTDLVLPADRVCGVKPRVCRACGGRGFAR